ncbi:zinc finger protein 483-like [Pangasianodon hypophthalmus]|uniref:zinc finger protein 483-like n=1 Tax=Pangasianodon hypophthalmus TaxID=310915 RepID=UPI002306EE00|nr:zinc finger protein 483-like [Pangasianodon hypophthalmus]
MDPSGFSWRGVIPDRELMLLQLILPHQTKLTSVTLCIMQSEDVKTAVLQLSEQHRQRFRSLSLSEVGDLFAFAQQLQDHCQKWLLAEDCDPRRIVELLVKEQFINQLPEQTAHWVQHHQPATPNEAIQMAENHLMSLVVSPLNISPSWVHSVKSAEQYTIDPSHHTEIMQLEESEDVKRAISQLSEQHRQRFRSLSLSEVGDPFTFVQQLQFHCQKWLLAEDWDHSRIVEQLVIEQFISKLPEETAHWVCHHQPETPNEAIQLAENHLESFAVSPTVAEGEVCAWGFSQISTVPVMISFWGQNHVQAVVSPATNHLLILDTKLA